MLSTADHALPCSASPEDAVANLAFAVLAQCVHDLEHGPPQKRAQARYDVQAGDGLCFWLDCLGLGDFQRRRVERLLVELATQS